jgi:cytochrome c556
MKKLIIATLAASVLCAPLAVAQEAKSEKQAKSAVQFRQAIFQLVRSNMGPLGGMAKGQIEYDAATMQVNGQRIEHLAMMIEDYFSLNTTAFDVKTGAKDSIWKSQDDFNSKAMDMVKAAQNLQTVAAAQDEANYRKAIGAVGATCKACHDDYKKD